MGQRITQTAAALKYADGKTAVLFQGPGVLIALSVLCALCSASCGVMGVRPQETGVVNLLDSPSYVRLGFNEEDLRSLPADPEAGGWHIFPPGQSVDSIDRWNLPGLPKEVFLSPFRRRPIEFTALIPFSLNEEQWQSLARDMTRAPGIYIPGLGENWEIYLNGVLLRSEIHLDSEGWVQSQRSVRGLMFSLPRELLETGENIFAFRFIGDPLSSATGFQYRAPFYIDDIEIIESRHNEIAVIAVISIFLFLAMYNFVVHIINQFKGCSGFCAIFSLIIGLYNLVRTRMIYTLIPDTEILFKLEYLCVFMLIPADAWFLEKFTLGRTYTFTKIISAVYAFFALIQVFLPYGFADNLLQVWMLSILPVIGCIIVLDVILPFVKAMKETRESLTAQGGKKSFSWVLLFWETLKGHDSGLLCFVMFLCAVGALLDLYDSLFLHLSLNISRYILSIYATVSTLLLTRRRISEVVTLRMIHERTVLEAETAKTASKAKSQFLANMSHEIRTPLNAIIGMSDLMRADNFDETQSQYLKDIAHMSHHLLEIINDILDFSKIEAGKMELVPTHYDLKAVFENINSLGRFMAEAKALRFRGVFEQGSPEVVYGDETRVQQILTNLVTNAVKYTQKGSIEFRLGEEMWEGRPYIAAEVRDTGMGIRDEDKGRLFKSFEQFDREKNRGVIGTGLGLAITEQLLRLMGGFIQVESVYGRGSVFKVYIPLEEGDPAKIHKIAGGGAMVRAATEDIKVLVVDDMRVNLSVAIGYLAQHGIYAETAESGEEALEKVAALAREGKKYDLILMDHMMPGMNGIETTRRYREMEEAENIPEEDRTPIVAFSANAVQGVREMFLSAGMDDFIAKPVKPTDVNMIIAKWLPPEKILLGEVPGRNAGEGGVPNSRVKVPVPAFAESLGLDMTVALEHLGNLKGVEDYLKMLAVDYDGYMEALKDAYNKKDWKKYTVRAHGFKGVFATLGNQKMSEQAKRLEFAAKEGRIAECEEKTEEFLDALAGFRERLLSNPLFKGESGQAGSPPQKEADAVFITQHLEDLYNAVRGARNREATEIAKVLDEVSLGGSSSEIWREGWTEIRNLLYNFENIKAAEKITGLMGELEKGKKNGG